MKTFDDLRLSSKLIGSYLFVALIVAITESLTIGSAQQSSLWIWVVGIVGVVLAVVLGTVISNSITRPLEKAASMLQQIGRGHLSNQLSFDRKDEVGLLGNVIDEFAQNLQVGLLGTLKKIADGDLSSNIDTKDVQDEISPVLQQMICSLRNLEDEAHGLTRSVINGKLSVRSDANKFKGSYREILQGFNDMLDGIGTPLSAAASYMASMAKGVLPPLVAEHYNGDFEVFKDNLNHLSERLREMLRSMGETSNSLSSASSEILAATTQQAAGASEQSAAISQTTTTVNEVKVISEQASQRAQEVANASQRTIEVVRSGQHAVQDTINSMNLIKEQVESISENLLALSDQTQQIGEIIASVNEIAAQSNMLALNASVEAARAGEHGKGFAVVAMEVRSLAEQSRQATAQVKTILSEIQKATNTTVMATEAGTKGVEHGVQLAAQAREAIDQLASVIDESAQMAAQVVAGGQQQQTGIEQIALAMQNINQATIQSLTSTRQTEKSARNLTELALQMTGVVNQYQF